MYSYYIELIPSKRTGVYQSSSAPSAAGQKGPSLSPHALEDRPQSKLQRDHCTAQSCQVLSSVPTTPYWLHYFSGSTQSSTLSLAQAVAFDLTLVATHHPAHRNGVNGRDNGVNACIPRKFSASAFRLPRTEPNRTKPSVRSYCIVQGLCQYVLCIQIMPRGVCLE